MLQSGGRALPTSGVLLRRASATGSIYVSDLHVVALVCNWGYISEIFVLLQMFATGAMYLKHVRCCNGARGALL